MKKSREQLKAELMLKMEEAVERLLDWQENGEGYTFREIEDEVLAIGQKVKEELTEATIGQEENRQPVEAPGCPGCGVEMIDKGMRSRQVQGRVGTVEVERSYYTCPECGEGFFPSGPQSEVDPSRME
jgi:predicted RNA-binding Zn-ribbon protein involved in translation (DUF1610 family)